MPSKWMKASIQQKYEEHRKRVREARSLIDKGKPPDMPLSMRRETERRRQQAAIELDNRLLLDRLGEAMSRKNIDNVLVPQQFISYLELQRKKELIRITQDNRRLLHRIQHTVPTYHPEEWQKDAERHEEYLRNMTEFPELFELPGQRPKASSIEGMPDRFKDNLGGALAINGSVQPSPSPIQLNPGALYSSRRSGTQNSRNSQTALRKSLHHRAASQEPSQASFGYQQKETEDALAETEAMFRNTFQLQNNAPHPPPMPPIATHPYASGDEEDDYDLSRNQFVSRPFLPNIHQSGAQQQSPPNSSTGVLKRR